MRRPWPDGVVRSTYNCPVLRVALMVFVCAIWAPSVWADAARDALSEIAQCTSIADSVARLRCFDRVAPRAKDALVPKAEDFGRPPPRPPEVDQLTATVRNLTKTARGRAVFVLDNGQTWRQLEGDDGTVPDPASGAGLKVTIERGAFGSYNLTIEGYKGVIKVRRLE